MIHDRLVVGIRDSKLSEKLQLGDALTLERAVTQIRRIEIVKHQQPERGVSISGTTPEAPVGAITKETVTNKHKSDIQEKQKGTSKGACGHCGKFPCNDHQHCAT